MSKVYKPRHMKRVWNKEEPPGDVKRVKSVMSEIVWERRGNYWIPTPATGGDGAWRYWFEFQDNAPFVEVD